MDAIYRRKDENSLFSPWIRMYVGYEAGDFCGKEGGQKSFEFIFFHLMYIPVWLYTSIPSTIGM